MAALTLAALCAGLYANVARIHYEEKYRRIEGLGTVTVNQKALALPVFCLEPEQKKVITVELSLIVSLKFHQTELDVLLAVSLLHKLQQSELKKNVECSSKSLNCC